MFLFALVTQLGFGSITLRTMSVLLPHAFFPDAAGGPLHAASTSAQLSGLYRACDAFHARALAARPTWPLQLRLFASKGPTECAALGVTLTSVLETCAMDGVTNTALIVRATVALNEVADWLHVLPHCVGCGTLASRFAGYVRCTLCAVHACLECAPSWPALHPEHAGHAPHTLGAPAHCGVAARVTALRALQRAPESLVETACWDSLTGHCAMLADNWIVVGDMLQSLARLFTVTSNEALDLTVLCLWYSFFAAMTQRGVVADALWERGDDAAISDPHGHHQLFLRVRQRLERPCSDSLVWVFAAMRRRQAWMFDYVLAGELLWLEAHVDIDAMVLKHILWNEEERLLPPPDLQGWPSSLIREVREELALRRREAEALLVDNVVATRWWPLLALAAVAAAAAVGGSAWWWRGEVAGEK